MRHADEAQGRVSDETARGVQVVHDTNQSFRIADEIDGPTIESPVFAVEPLSGRTLFANDRVERTEGSNEKQRELPFFSVLLEFVVARVQAGDG